MSRIFFPLCLCLAASVVLGCDARGIRVGTEELCVLDAELRVAQVGSTESLSSCATIGENQLKNPNFEASRCESEFYFCQLPAADTGGWQTTSEAQVIEVWMDGHRGVPAVEGSQFVELDANMADTLWQDVELPPDQLMYWSFLHRGRLGLEDVELQLGPPDAPTLERTFSSPPDAWYQYSGLYRTAADETLTRFALVSRSGKAEGNLVDSIVFAPGLPASLSLKVAQNF